MKPIDFVIPWVDGNDPEWQKELQRYSAGYEDIGNHVARFREWDNLQFWFRGVEKFAPWVNKIHFVTWGHIPSWMNVKHPKLNIVRHEDFIPKKYLPTFNSHTIELNLHRIEGLQEQFVYFNDDVFLTNLVKPEDFFKDNLPCDTFALNVINFDKNSIGHIVGSDIQIINQNFHKKEGLINFYKKWLNPKNGISSIIRTILLSPWPFFTGFHYKHISNSYLKSTFEMVWGKEEKVLDATCQCRFRKSLNVNQWVMKFWQLASGNFYPRNSKLGKCFHINDDNFNEVCEYIGSRRIQIICLNDTEQMTGFSEKRAAINNEFEKILGEKSSFECD